LKTVTRFQIIEVMLFHCGQGDITFMRHRSGLGNP
jgi:hypothetical protein